MMYYTKGEMLVLHVPMQTPLTLTQQEALKPVFAKWGFLVPASWDHPDTEDKDGVYHEMVQGYIMDQDVTTQPLKEVFLPHEPVEQYVHVLEVFESITQEVQTKCNRPDVSVGKCRVGFVSWDPTQ